MRKRAILLFLILQTATILLAFAASPWLHAAERAPRVVDLNALPALESIAPKLAGKRVVFIGEIHTRYDHHLNQLDVIRRLHGQGAPLAIGVECFQQPYQRHLDDYIAGKIDEHELLRKTEYYQRWRFDFRLYAPILAFAREHRIPVVALNVPGEITTKVGRDGLDALTPEERKWVPQTDDTDAAYRERLRSAFEQHPREPGSVQTFENFLAAQLVWDEGMAQRAADYLKANPRRRMVVLAGSGHLAYGAGIPRRLTRRLPVETAIVLHDGFEPLGPGVADFLLLSEEKRLPPAGVLGVVLGKQGQAVVTDFAKGSAAEAAGIRRGDGIVAIDGSGVANLGEVKAALWDKRPGDAVRVDVRRGGDGLEFAVTLR